MCRRPTKFEQVRNYLDGIAGPYGQTEQEKKPMKLGMFMMPLHPPEKSRTQSFDEDIEVVVAAEVMGFTEVWVGQHHTLAWEPLPSNDIFIASVIPRTSKIRLGPGVTIMPQHHPANVAVRLAMLDHLSRGLGTLRPARWQDPGIDDRGGHRYGAQTLAGHSAL
jgi:Luciferase-like monooxygenase